MTFTEAIVNRRRIAERAYASDLLAGVAEAAEAATIAWRFEQEVAFHRNLSLSPTAREEVLRVWASAD